jgi:hypothetical protein
MANTYEAIATVTVGSGGAATIEFTSIPATYTDLLVKVSARASVDTVQASISFNGSTSSRTNIMLYGNGSSAGSESLSDMYSYGNVTSSVATANTFANAEYYIPNYAGSTYKSMSGDSVNERNATTAYSSITASLWSNTAAITSWTITCPGGNFVQYSTATLYGIKNS